MDTSNVPNVQDGILLTVPCPLCHAWAKLLDHERGFECRACGCVITRNALRHAIHRTRQLLLETVYGVRAG